MPEPIARSILFDQIQGIVQASLDQADLRLTDTTAAADVPGWNSFRMIEIILAIEARYGVAVETRDMDEIHVFADLVQRVSDKIRFGPLSAS